jgi:hypothetical protein
MQSVLVISFSDLGHDPRVHRQLRFLAKRYRVIAAGLADPGLDSVRFIPIAARRNGLCRNLSATAMLACGFHERYYWQKSLVCEAMTKLAGVSADLIVANDLVTLPLALRLARGACILFDAHEYSPRELEHEWLWRLLFRSHAETLCRRCIPQVDAMTTVCEGIAEAYQTLTGVKPAVLTNAPEYRELAPRPYRAALRPVQLIHHGILHPTRKLENLIAMMDHLDERFELNLMLVGGDRTYNARLDAMARSRPRVRFLAPVPMPTLPEFLNQFDLGVYLCEPVNFNSWLALPNKFFEFIQGRLGVAIGPSPEMARIVRATGCGVVAPDFQPASLAVCLNRLDEPAINAFKARSHAAAAALSATANEQLLLDLVERTLGHGRRAA